MLFLNKQEPDIQYVEGYDELEEEDDMEDFAGLGARKSLGDDDDDNEDGRVCSSSFAISLMYCHVIIIYDRLICFSVEVFKKHFVKHLFSLSKEFN